MSTVASHEYANHLKEKSKGVHKRTVSPVSGPLVFSETGYSRFHQIISDTAASEGGVGVARPKRIHRPSGIYHVTHNTIDIAFNGLTPTQIISLAAIAKSAFGYQEVKGIPSFTIPLSTSRGVHRLGHRIISPRLSYYLSNSDEGPYTSNPYTENGLFIQGRRHLPLIGLYAVEVKKFIKDVPERGKIIIQDVDSLSEVEMAYLSVMTSMILGGSLDLSTPERMEETKDRRREIFMRMYREMLSDMFPKVEKEDVVGLESQFDDINTNLIKPLVCGRGRPMNTILVGAPGVGKSFAVRALAFESDALVVKVPVETFSGDGIQRSSFEHYLLPRLQRLKAELNAAPIIWVDDTEALMEQGLTTNPNGSVSRTVDAEKRARALGMLERMMDTYGILYLGTLNHPDVEAAFLRRFNPVYFPLPNSIQRRVHLQKITGGMVLGKDLERMVDSTNGFNYSAIDTIRDYLANRVGEEDVKVLSEKELHYAISKARERSDIKSLRMYDDAALQMVGKRRSFEGLKAYSKRVDEA